MQGNQEVPIPNTGGTDHVCVDIERGNTLVFPRQIHKVHYSLRSINDLDYEPLALSIGPYHHRMKERFEDMDKCKEIYLDSLIGRMSRRNQGVTLEEEMKLMEKQVRACYASSYRTLESKQFVRMMVLDGCFIIELFRKLAYKDIDLPDEENDIIYKNNVLISHLYRDLVLFENQLPLIVLQKLFELTKGPEDLIGNFIDLGLRGLQSVVRKDLVDHDLDRQYLDRSPHLLGLIYLAFLLPFPEMSSCVDTSYEDIRSVVELHEAGLEFKVIKGEIYQGIGAIKFSDNGVLELPYMIVDDYTESLIRNFIAYEQYSERNCLHYVTDYYIFMDCLINTSKDVELLRRARIIRNCLGDDERMSIMFNRLTISVYDDSESFYYAKEFKSVNRYCTKKRNIWMAKLRREYFNSPWSILSFLAAVTLLVLTFIQATFSVISYVSLRS